MEKSWQEVLPAFEMVLDELLERIKTCLEEASLILTYKYRVKTFSSYFEKYIKFMRNSRSSNTPMLPITDVLAIRIICPFIGDLQTVEKILSDCFTVREVEHKGAKSSFREFGYQSTHLLIELPAELRKGMEIMDQPVCEVQIRTILQDAWAEVEHELVYKAEFTPFDDPMKRKLAALNANLTLSDMLFQEIRDYQHQLNSELDKRRVAFFRKIEDSIDSSFYARNSGKGMPSLDERLDDSWFGPWRSVDDLLLEALNAHNRGDFAEAIKIYTYILDVKPKDEVRAIIYKHRGMAFFSESRYEEAIGDFSLALEMDEQNYKAVYYRGVVRSVQENYKEAIEDFNLALDMHPYHFYSIYRRAQAYYHLGDYPKVLADCEQALELDRNNSFLKKLKKMALEMLEM